MQAGHHHPPPSRSGPAALLLAVLTWCCAVPADAYFVRITANLSVQSPGAPLLPNVFIDTGEVTALSIFQPLVVHTDTGDNGMASASFLAEVSPGLIRVLTSGVADDSTFNSSYAIQPFGGRPSWGDEITFTSAGTFKFTLTMDSRVSGGPSKGPGMATTPGAECSSNQASAFFVVNGPIILSVKDELCDGDQSMQSFTQSLELPFGVGQTLDVSGNLHYGLFGNSNGGVPVATEIDAFSTVRFNIDPVTPGAAYATASGVSYVTPAPEPGVQLLAPAAAATLALLARTRRRRVVANERVVLG